MESFGKFITNKTASGATVGGHLQYIQLLESTLHAAGILQPWVERSLNHEESGISQEVAHLLGRISAFFHNVICPMALSDLHHTLQYHLQHTKAVFDKHM